MVRLALGLLIALSLLAPQAVRARVWTDDLRRTWEGEFVRLDGGNAIFLVAGKEYPFVLARLSAGDRTWIVTEIARTRLAPATPAPQGAQSPATAVVAPASGGEPMFGNVKLVPGRTVQTDLPLPPSQAKALGAAYGRDTTLMKAAVAVPAGFDPAKPQRLLITTASSSGDGLSIKNMESYTAAALARGWVVMAAEGEFGKAKEDGIRTRANLLEVMLKEIETRWPKAKTTWSVATAGFSGGAGYASYQALFLSGLGWRVNGMLMMNSAYSPQNWEQDKDIKGSKAKGQKIPIFVSAGQSDTTQKPEQVRQSIENMKKGGYRTLRDEWHAGGHQADKGHMALALEWFEGNEKGAAKGL